MTWRMASPAEWIMKAKPAYVEITWHCASMMMPSGEPTEANSPEESDPLHTVYGDSRVIMPGRSQAKGKIRTQWWHLRRAAREQCQTLWSRLRRPAPPQE